MEQIQFELTSEHIELLKLLKITGVVGSGGEAKHLIATGDIKVNGELTLVKRLKIKKGDTVSSEGFWIQVM